MDSYKVRLAARIHCSASTPRPALGGDGVTRPKGQHAATFARRLALLARLDGRAGTIG